MGAQTSRDGRSQEDASASASASAQELGAEVKSNQEEDSVLDSKPLQKNGQISSMTSLNGHSEDNTLAEVGQPDGVSVAQKEEAPETMDTIQDEVTPQVNGEKVEKESPDAIEVSTTEEKKEEEKPVRQSSEVGFKKIFRFVGFRFTLKKNKGDEMEPVKLITVKDKEEEASGADTAKDAKEEAPIAEVSAEEKVGETETSTTESAKETSTTETAKETSTSEATKETSTSEAAKETSTAEAAKEASTAEADKEASTSEAVEEASTSEAPKETSTIESDKETSTTEAAKETSTSEAAKETSTSEAAKETSTAEDAKETSTSEADKEASTSESAKEASTSETAKEASTSETAKEASTSETPMEASTSETPMEASTSETAKEASTSETVKEASTSETAKEASTSETAKEASTSEAAKDTDEAATTEVPPEGTVAETVDEEAKKEGGEKESESSPPPQEVPQSTFRKFFTVASLFSNLRKKSSIKKSKEEEQKESAVEEETPKAEETTEAVKEEEKKVDVEQEAKEEPPTVTSEEAKKDLSTEPEAAVEIPAPEADTTDEAKPEEEGEEVSAEEEKAPAEVSSEAELLSSQERTKVQGSPLKKLFTGAGLKKLSTKKQKNKRDGETKLTESGEQAVEQFQSSAESTEVPKPDAGTASPEDSGDHVVTVEVTQPEPSQEAEGEVTSDGEKKKEGITAWSSFKKLVTPKKHVKKSSESEDEATGDKPVNSATLSSTESAVFVDKCSEEEAKDKDKPTEEEPNTENTEKLASSTEESKKKMDTSVSWEALMCMGGTKKRTRRTSDSDDDETKIDEPPTEEGEQKGNTAEAPAVVTSQEAETESEVVSSPEPLSSPPERESAWDTLKRLVMVKNKAKVEEKTEESSEQVLSDSEVPKEESSFSLRKFFPGRRKKKIEKPPSPEVVPGEEDSDTPAVVPLSEYDVEPVEQEQEQPETPAIVQTTVSAEERSPSWIPANVEDVSDQHDQLSDIPEEAENAATPKSADTTIAEDDIEDQAMQSAGALDRGRRGRRLSTAEVKPVVPAPSAETTPVPQGPHSENTAMVREDVVEQVAEIPYETSVISQDVPAETATVKIEHEPQVEHAETKVNRILEPHICADAMAICTGLGTKEIAKLALEKPVMPISECMSVISDALCAEVAVEEKPSKIENAIVTEDPVLEAQVHQVEITKLEAPVQTIVNEIPEVQFASRDHEPQIEVAAVVSTVVAESEIVQPPEVRANSPKSMLMNPIIPTIEAAVYTETAEVTQPAVQIKENEIHMEQFRAIGNNIPVPEMAHAVSHEMTSTLSDTNKNSIMKRTEPGIVVVLPEEVATVNKTMILAGPKEEMVIGKASISEPVIGLPGQVQPIIKVTAADSSNGMEQVNDIEEQSMVIAQAVIQTAMNKMSEPKPEHRRPPSPTTIIPGPVQAVAKKEEEIEIETEKPVITEAPVVVTCEAPASPKSPKSRKTLHAAIQVIDAIPVEFIEGLDDPAEKEKPEKGLKQAVEVTASEETVIVEEVVEMLESETGGELEDVKKEQSKEDTVTQKVVPATGSSEVTKAEAPLEEKKEKTIHMPVQVVLHMAQVVEDQAVEEEALVEFDSNGPINTMPAAKSPKKGDSPSSQKPLSDSLPTLYEEPQTIASTDVAAPSQGAAASPAETEKAASGKCAEVMAQVIEVIEEAVKEIEPVSTQITAAS